MEQKGMKMDDVRTRISKFENNIKEAKERGDKTSKRSLKEENKKENDKKKTLEAELLQLKQRKNGPQSPYKGIARLLIYLAPPVRQKFRENDKRNRFLNFLTLENSYDKANNSRMLNEEPTSYDQLIVLYSQNDWTAKAGAVDQQTWSGIVTTMLGCTIISTYLYKELQNKTPDVTKTDIAINLVKALPPLLYSATTAFFALTKKAKYAHTYLDIVPKNLFEENKCEINGPKTHVKMLVDGKEIGHSSTDLIENIAYIWKVLTKEYRWHMANSKYFTLNINKARKIIDHPIITNNEQTINYSGIDSNFIQCYTECNEKVEDLFNSVEREAMKQQITISIYNQKITREGFAEVGELCAGNHHKVKYEALYF